MFPLEVFRKNNFFLIKTRTWESENRRGAKTKVWL